VPLFKRAWNAGHLKPRSLHQLENKEKSMRTYRRPSHAAAANTESKQLRERFAVEHREVFSMERFFSELYNELLFHLVRMFPPAKTNSMCKYYGHVVNREAWHTGLPSCIDCGKTIRCPSELRTASPREVAQ
jgi:hypothetical protein